MGSHEGRLRHFEFGCFDLGCRSADAFIRDGGFDLFALLGDTTHFLGELLLADAVFVGNRFQGNLLVGLLHVVQRGEHDLVMIHRVVGVVHHDVVVRDVGDISHVRDVGHIGDIIHDGILLD